MESIEELINVNEENENVLITEKEDVEKEISTLLDAYFEIILYHKKINNYSNKMLNNLNVVGIDREKEIVKIESKSKSKEEKRVNKLLKKHKLGEHGIGTSSAIYKYNSKFFEKEIDKMKSILEDEKYKEYIGDDYSNLQKEIFGDLVNDSEYQKIEHYENNDLSMFAEDGDAAEEGFELNYND